MYHALALLAGSLGGDSLPGGAAVTAGWLFVAGTLIFSGSLYLNVVSPASAGSAHHAAGGLSCRRRLGALAWAALRERDPGSRGAW